MGSRAVWTISAVALAGFVWLGFSFSKGSSVSLPIAGNPSVQLTAYRGEERQPAFSPDGNQVAFARREAEREDYDIWVKFVGQEGALRLTSDPADEMSPAWAPDGSRIAFLRHKAGGLADVVLISPHGGTERTLAQIYSRSNLRSSLDWSPDGTRLVTHQISDSGGERGLFTISIDSGAKERLLDKPARGPAYSRDGKTIAFLLGYSQPDLAVMPSEGGDFRLLGYSLQSYGGTPVAWAPAEKGLIAGRPPVAYPFDGGQPIPLAGVGTDAVEPAVSNSAGRFVYAVQRRTVSSWLLDAGVSAAAPREFAPSSKSTANPQFSRDGALVVFTSNRSGRLEIWVADRDGANLRQLTDMGVGGTPRWSPDHSEVVFDGSRDGASEIFAVSSFGGAPRLITRHAATDVVPSYSNDGRWVYFASDRSGEWQTWRVSIEGEEKRPESLRQMTRGGGYAAFEPPGDDGFLYYAKKRILEVGSANSLWRVPVNGGPEEVVIDGLYSSRSNWALAGSYVYFLNPADERQKPEGASEWAIYKMHLRTRKRSFVALINGEPWAGPSLDVSHDERWILYSTINPAESDLMLIEGFR